MHMETKPMSWGTTANNNCDKCHQNMQTAGNMGVTCGNCHEHSFDPHIVAK